MRTRRRRGYRRSVCLLCALLAGVGAQLQAQTVAEDTSLQTVSSDVSAIPSTSAVPLKDEGALRYEEAERQYKYALDLLDTLKARSVPIVAPPPPTSLFSSASYTPFLNLIERANRGPLSPLIRVTRRFLAKRQPQEASQEVAKGWSLHRLLRKLKGDEGLLGQPASETKILAGNGPLSPKQVKKGADEAVKALTSAAELGKTEAHRVLGDLFLRNTTRAFENYKRLADLTGDVQAQYNLGFLYSSGFDGVFGPDAPAQGEGDQGMALLYYTFAALGQAPQAEMAAGYRHWVGIGTRQSCGDALPFYKKAADKAMAHFVSGPPGGRHLPPVKTRLSDLAGGVYGPGASVSVGFGGSSRTSSGGMSNPSTLQEWDDVLEYYQFHADRGDASFMFRLARIYYQGYGPPAMRAELGGRDFPRALKWFTRIARTVWPRDVSDPAKDVKIKVNDHLTMVAGLAAGYLGRMHLRGEGVPQDFAKASLWFHRGIGQGDQQSHNGLGIMLRDGLGMKAEPKRAVALFQAAASENFAEAQVNLGRHHLAERQAQMASQFFEIAVRNGDQIQAYYYLAELNAHAVGRPDLCPVAVAFYKIVAERGDWLHEVWWEAERAWARGDKDTALLGYWMMAERGYEVAQNNIAYIFDREKRQLTVPIIDSNTSSPAADRLALTFWTRSAAQDNIDALLKMGDYYLKGVGVPSGLPQPEKAAACYQSAATTQMSALAMHNLGWLHENGIGVKKDYHLAKRYYDLAFETNTDSYFPVLLSLFKLHLRSLWDALNGGGFSSLSLFDPNNQANVDELNKMADEHSKQLSDGAKKLKQDLRQSWWMRKLFGNAPGAANQAQQNPLNRLQQAFERAQQQQQAAQAGQQPQPHAGQAQGQQQPVRQQPGPGQQAAPQRDPAIVEAQRALQGDEDPVAWAREARAREQEGGELGEGEYDDLLEGNDGVHGPGVTGFDEGTETLLLVGLCIFVAWLVAVRQERQRRQEREQRQRNERQRAAAQ